MSSPADFLQYAWEHRSDDVSRLLLQGCGPAAAQQIEGLQTAPAKWPSLADKPDFIFPPRLNREQSSSEAAARYKASIVGSLDSAADLTGGMGIDTLFLSRQVRTMHYVERDPALCDIARHNFAVLGASAIQVHCADSIPWLADRHTQPPFSLLYIDPSRRSSSGARVVAFDHCQPDVLALLSSHASAARRFLIKASPMISIPHAVAQLSPFSLPLAVHVVAVKGECKEVLFFLGADQPGLHCVNIRVSATDLFSLATDDWLHPAPPVLLQPSSHVASYLYEPHAALMKGACFSALGRKFDIPMLDPATHLFTADRLIPDFPGRIFRVIREISPSRKALKEAIPDARAHVICRNYPLRADTLQRQLRLHEGGDTFLVATTVAGRPTAFLSSLVKSAIQ